MANERQLACTIRREYSGSSVWGRVSEHIKAEALDAVIRGMDLR